MPLPWGTETRTKTKAWAQAAKFVVRKRPSGSQSSVGRRSWRASERRSVAAKRRSVAAKAAARRQSVRSMPGA